MSFHLIPQIPDYLNIGIPFISLIDEVTMKIIWSKAFDTSSLFPITYTVNYKMTSLAVSRDRSKIAGLTSNTGSVNFLFILERDTGSTLQI